MESESSIILPIPLKELTRISKRDDILTDLSLDHFLPTLLSWPYPLLVNESTTPSLFFYSLLYWLARGTTWPVEPLHLITNYSLSPSLIHTNLFSLAQEGFLDSNWKKRTKGLTPHDKVVTLNQPGIPSFSRQGFFSICKRKKLRVTNTNDRPLHLSSLILWGGQVFSAPKFKQT